MKLQGCDRQVFIAVLATLTALAAATEASAYVGPGAGLSAIGSLAAVLGAAALAVVGFIWYPIRRLLRKIRAGKPT